MAIPLGLQDSAQIVVLPQRPAAVEFPGAILNAAAAVDLAILGAAAQRNVTLDRLVEIVFCLAGDGWSPAQEVVYGRLQNATEQGWISARESWVRSMPFLYGLTQPGARHLTELMRRPVPQRDAAEARAIASIKFALLDLLDGEDGVAVNADLRRFYLYCRDRLALRRRMLPDDRPLFADTIAAQEHQVEGRIARLDDMRDGGTVA